jgi:hypothetical protein
MKHMSDYESGVIDQKTISKIEGEIMASLNKPAPQITKLDDIPGSWSSLGLGL